MAKILPKMPKNREYNSKGTQIWRFFEFTKTEKSSDLGHKITKNLEKSRKISLFFDHPKTGLFEVKFVSLFPKRDTTKEFFSTVFRKSKIYSVNYITFWGDENHKNFFKEKGDTRVFHLSPEIGVANTKVNSQKSIPSCTDEQKVNRR